MLTAARARGSKAMRCNSIRGKDRLDGIVPVVEDWHAKMCFLEVCHIFVSNMLQLIFHLLQMVWKRLYKIASVSNGGTLYQLRNLLNRRNVTKQNMSACEEFFILVVEAHILVAAMETFNMTSLNDEPSTPLLPSGCTELTPNQRKEVLILAVKDMLHRFVDIEIPPFPSQSKGTSDTGTTNHEHDAGSDTENDIEGDITDHIHEYAKEVLSLSLLYLEFCDAIKEGDGHRIIRCWRFFLPLFKASKRTNYSKEAFILLAQHDLLFSPRMEHQLLWSRTINTVGRPGRNIACDMHMEHLVCQCKAAMGVLGPNVTREASISHTGKSVGFIMEVVDSFDASNNVKQDW